MGYNAAVQVLKNAEVYKAKVAAKRDLLSESDAWADQQQLQTIYHQVIVLDLEYALDKKVEQELWNIGFKHYISLLQEQIRDRKNPKRSDLQALLSWSLEAASGFYISLLQELCVAFDLDVPFYDVRTKYERVNNGTSNDLLLAQSSSCNYICQYCLVHLGDIARYRNQRVQAANFYKHAITLSPNSGQPYNQLALLEASLGDKLSSVYYYVQAIAVKNPFPGAITNLSSTLATCINKDDYLTEVLPRMQLPRFLSTYLQAYALLHSAPSSCNFQHHCTLAVQSTNATITALVATKALTAARLLQLTVINLYMVYHLEEEDVEESNGRKDGKNLVVALIAGALNALLLPVYTMKMEEVTLLEYYALPAIKIILFWIQKHPKVLEEKHFTTRLQIWPSFCKLLNSLTPLVKDFNASKYHDVPLTEDIEIQGFIPLSCIFKKYNFKSKNLLSDSSDTGRKLRAARIIKIGHWLASLEENEQKLIILKTIDDGTVHFEPCCIQPDPTNEILEEIKSFTIDNVEDPKGKEKRGGILKPQGSLEKAREERSQLQFSQQNSSENTSASKEVDAVKLKKAPSNNVALQSILKKIEENKQVKFSSETTDKEKDKTLLQKVPRNPQISSIQTNLQSTSNKPLSTQMYMLDSKSYYDNTKPRQNNNDSLQNQISNLASNASIIPINPVQNAQNIPTQFSVPPPTHNMFNYPPPNMHANQTLVRPNQNLGQVSLHSVNPSQKLLQSQNFDHNIQPQQNPTQNLNFSMQNQNVPMITQAQLPSQNMKLPPPGVNIHMDMQLNVPGNIDNAISLPSQSQQYNMANYSNALPLHSQSNIWNSKNQTNWWPRNVEQNIHSQSMEYGSNYLSNRSNAPGPFEPMGSPWTDRPHIPGPGGNFSTNPPGLSSHGQHQNMSIRQAMLNEANKYAPRVNNAFAGGNMDTNNMSSGSSAYSLFNPSGWTPNLPGQHNNLDQSSNNSRQPQSLQQLLDLQNRLKKGDT